MGAPKTEAQKEMEDVMEFMSSFFNLTWIYFWDIFGEYSIEKQPMARSALFKRLILLPPFENIGEFGANYPEVTL